MPSHPPNGSPESARGSCLCGAVQFEAALPSKWMAHCHCTMCQRAHGAGVVTWVGFHEHAVNIEAAHGALRWHASSPEAQRGFCAQCGSPMFFRSSRWAGELHVARALVSTPLDREPSGHVFFDTHVSWLALGDDLPRK